MNRILQAEVILTLTREQAEALLGYIERTSGFVLWGKPEVQAIVQLREQCAKQGVQL